MDEAMNVLNNVTRKVADQYQIPLYDLAATMPKSREFFFDDVHFNDQGARTAAHELANVILSKSPPATLDRPH